MILLRKKIMKILNLKNKYKNQILNKTMKKNKSKKKKINLV